MKKYLFLLLVPLFYINSNAQNVGLVVGGGLAQQVIKTDDPEFDDYINSEELNFAKIYQLGINFENVLKEKQLYLQFGLYAKSSGYASHNDSVGMYIYTINIPLELKYKYFFDKNKIDTYLYGSAGPYASLSYKGIKYDQFQIDDILAGRTTSMDNPRVKFGKTADEDIEAIDYGINFGIGVGHKNFQLGYSFSLGLHNMVPRDILIDDDFSIKNRAHTITFGYYFSNK